MPNRLRSARHFRVLTAASLFLAVAAHGQQSSPETHSALTLTSAPMLWVNAATQSELQIINSEGHPPLAYRTRHVDSKGDTTREVIETQQGTVARLVERDGKPLSAEADAAERERLNEIVTSPADFLKHHKRDAEARKYTLDVIREIPNAFLFAYVPGQPQTAEAHGQQIVLDFTPNPDFKPPSTVSQILSGLQGRLWIDAQARCLARLEAHVIKPVNFGWGVLARVHPGGSVIFDQADAGNGRWVYTHMTAHLTVREALVKTSNVNAEGRSFNFRFLPAPVPFQEAVRALLEQPLASH